MSLIEWANGLAFKAVHSKNLVYNTCWEDPRLDREALNINSDDSVLVITSAGCNALDYALLGPKNVYAVDLNLRQNALLELKLAAIRKFQYEDFFDMFGRGRLKNAGKVYHDVLRSVLSQNSQKYWDKWISLFDADNRRSFYFRGSSGAFAWAMNYYVDRVARLRPWVNEILEAKTTSEQREIYDNKLRDRFWTAPVRFIMNRDATLSLVGVPPAQRKQVETQYGGGLLKFLQDCLESVFARLPLHDNYFWRVYLTGAYSPDCCPEYLKPDNFQKFKEGLADRVRVSTDSVQGFLEKNDVQVSKFVLLDHMDWLSSHLFPALESEWQAIVNRAAPQSKVIWRSGGLSADFVDRARVTLAGRSTSVGELLAYDIELASRLHHQCRVHTYGSFYIADLAV